MELNSSTVFSNDNQSSSAAQPVVMSLIAVIVLLIGTVARKDMITKLTGLVDFGTSKSITGVPSVPAWILLKSFLLYGTDLQKIVEVAVAKYGGIFKLNILGIYSIVFVTNPSMVQKLYISTKPGHLHKTTMYNKTLVGALKDGLAGSRADVWKMHRSAVSKVFTYKGLLRHINIFEEHAKKLVLSLQESCLSPVNQLISSFEKQVQGLILDTILHMAAGKEMHEVSEAEKTQFRQNFERLKALISYRVYHPIFYMDFVWNFSPRKWEMDRRLTAITNDIDKVITRIRKQLYIDAREDLKTDGDTVGKSLVEVLIKAELSNEEIFAEVATFLAAGQDTISITLCLLMFLLALHNEYQDKCREEIDQMFNTISASNSNQISMEAINSLTFLDMCIKECLRLYPLFPVLGRALESSIQISEKIYLPRGTDVYVSPWIIHHDPKIYPEPEKYNPERFSPKEVGKMGPCEYIPFSTGPRNCIGYKSATLELKTLAAYVLHNFEVHSDMSIDTLNQKLRKTIWPFPELGIKIHPRP